MGFVTIPSMLADMKSGDENAWAHFTRYYGPLIWLRGNDYHLTPDEQQELSQDVLVAFFKAQDHFEYKPDMAVSRLFADCDQALHIPDLASSPEAVKPN